MNDEDFDDEKGIEVANTEKSRKAKKQAHLRKKLEERNK
jgi:hypothetical protein